MAHDEGLAQLLRDALADRSGVTEKRMFGGLCFMLNGNMLCGVHGAKSSNGGAMFRVGKDNEAEALAIEGAAPMTMTGRRMGGFVDATPETLADDAKRGRLLSLALDYVAALPPK